MKYNEGDKVRIKSKEWYNNNKDEYGNVHLTNKYGWMFTERDSRFCGKVVTILSKGTTSYAIIEDGCEGFWTDEMIECKVEEEMPLNIDDFQDDNEIGDVIDEYVYRLKDNECQINLPKGYIFKDENGNVINATKIVLEKKKKEYPKTYGECCKIMDIDTGFLLTSYDLDFWKGHLLTSLQKLLICRDAYWKIAGEEMGLGKPWEPSGNEDCFVISRSCGEVYLYSSGGDCEPFEFPTKEMRDAFYENFKEEIEICKELL